MNIGPLDVLFRLPPGTALFIREQMGDGSWEIAWLIREESARLFAPASTTRAPRSTCPDKTRTPPATEAAEGCGSSCSLSLSACVAGRLQLICRPRLSGKATQAAATNSGARRASE